MPGFRETRNIIPGRTATSHKNKNKTQKHGGTSGSKFNYQAMGYFCKHFSLSKGDVPLFQNWMYTCFYYIWI